MRWSSCPGLFCINWSIGLSSPYSEAFCSTIIHFQPSAPPHAGQSAKKDQKNASVRLRLRIWTSSLNLSFCLELTVLNNNPGSDAGPYSCAVFNHLTEFLSLAKLWPRVFLLPGPISVRLKLSVKNDAGDPGCFLHNCNCCFSPLFLPMLFVRRLSRW